MNDVDVFATNSQISSPTRMLFLRARLLSTAALILAVVAVGLLR